jgi:hypothetical protein
VSNEWPKTKSTSTIYRDDVYTCVATVWPRHVPVPSEILSASLNDKTKQIFSRRKTFWLHYRASSRDQNTDDPDRAVLWFPWVSSGRYVEPPHAHFCSHAFQFLHQWHPIIPWCVLVADKNVLIHTENKSILMILTINMLPFNNSKVLHIIRLLIPVGFEGILYNNFTLHILEKTSSSV